MTIVLLTINNINNDNDDNESYDNINNSNIKIVCITIKLPQFLSNDFIHL